MEDPMTANIAIIGAGIAGLESARQLLLRGEEKITIFEKTDRVGGRVFSRDLGDDNGVVELGAGRFSPWEHQRLMTHVARLGLRTKPFDFTLSAVQRGLHEQSWNLLKTFCDELGEYHAALPMRERQRTSLEEAALASIGKTKFDYLIEMSGYDTLANPALTFEEGFQLLRHHPETCGLFAGEPKQWMAFADGFSCLADALHADIRGDVRLELEHELSAVRSSAVAGYTLGFETPNGCKTHAFDKVLLAMPVSAIGKLHGMTMSSLLRDSISHVPLTKAYVAYATRWWAGMGVQGRCFSTSSIFRKVYFPADGNYLLVYADGGSAEDLHRAFADGRDLRPEFNEAIQLALPFGLESGSIPQPVETRHQFWPEGISFWRNGISLVSAGFWPIDDNACVCSDLFTEHLGWVEGALESAAHAAAYISPEMETHEQCPVAA
jgi:monoamine oxidase